MASSFLVRIAHSHPEWQAAWAQLDAVMTRVFDKAGLADPLIWAGIRVDRDGLGLLLKSVGIDVGEDPAETTRVLDSCERLQAVARRIGEMWVEQQATTSDTQLSLDVAMAKRARQE